MKLLLKLSAIFIVVFGLGLWAVAFLFRHSLENNARSEVLDRAGMIIGTAAAMRNYTNTHVKPALADASHTADGTHDAHFHPETVPAFASTELFNSLRGQADGNFADYFYKEATLNPTNLRDRATEWEADVVNEFRNHPDMKQLSGERATPTGQAMYLAKPLVAGKSCLECHSTAAEAPVAMIQQYGPVNGFGWKENEIIGAQIISVPVAKATGMADRAFYQLLFSFLGVGLATLVVLDLVIYFMVIRALGRFASNADQISRGKLDVPELQVQGQDEISVLATAFKPDAPQPRRRDEDARKTLTPPPTDHAHAVCRDDQSLDEGAANRRSHLPASRSRRFSLLDRPPEHPRRARSGRRPSWKASPPAE